MAVSTLMRVTDDQSWLCDLRASGAEREAAIAALHDLLLRGARFELNRRRHSLSRFSHEDIDDLATQAADDALVAVLNKLDTFRGASRFTTWAYKFALLEAGVKARRRAWQGREVVLGEEAWPLLGDRAPSAQQVLEQTELLAAIRRAVHETLTARQREVFIALALNEVPIDVLAERLGTTRGALYKTLHDARRKIRDTLTADGHSLDDHADNRDRS
jgi:RNA polymerase sigma-70 factor, ECF subfamily